MKTTLSCFTKINLCFLRRLTISFSLFFAIPTSSQIIVLLDEDFEGSNVPTSWEISSGYGLPSWTFGTGVMPGSGTLTVQNFPNNAAIFDDNATGNTGTLTIATLFSPPINAYQNGLYEKANIKLRFQYALNNQGYNNGVYEENYYSDLLRTTIVDYNNPNGLPYNSILYTQLTTDPVYHWANLSQWFINNPEYNISEFRIVWNFEDWDGSWGWGAGIDDVAVMINPDNDNCTDAFVVDALPYNIYTNAIGATNYPDFVTDCGTGMNDGVWYTFTPTQDGNIQIHLDDMGASTGFLWDAEIALYSGSCGNFNCVTYSDAYGPGGDEIINVTVQAGVTYFLNIGDFHAGVNEQEGLYELTITGNNILGTPKYEISGFTMYPNPATTVLNLKSPTLLNQAEVYNILGQKVLQNNPGSYEAGIDLSTLSQGSYILKVQAGKQWGAYHFIKE